MTGAARAPLTVAILISGRGSNMVAIAEAARQGRLPIRVAAVISDQPQAPGLTRARELGLPTTVVACRPGVERPDYDRELGQRLNDFSPRLVVLAGFMRILGTALVQEYSGRLLNIHPSLLPRYRGLHTHARVLAAGEHEHGCSVHFVTEELDGGPVVLQARVPVLAGDTEESLSARVQAQEHRIYPMVIGWYATGRLEWRENQPWLDGQRLSSPVVVSAGELEPA
ncbi:MAG TPA: phosphoribosylglycinamide formyltransferase [Steroidobacteraceae bacterium]